MEGEADDKNIAYMIERDECQGPVYYQKWYGRRQVVCGVDYDVDAGEVVVGGKLSDELIRRDDAVLRLPDHDAAAVAEDDVGPRHQPDEVGVARGLDDEGVGQSFEYGDDGVPNGRVPV